MDRATRQAARTRFLAAIEAGHSWQEAAALADLPIKRSAAYDLQRRVRLYGSQVLDDQRHGHPSKARADVQAWLAQTCRDQPSRPSWQLQQDLARHFGLSISMSQINRLRAALGLPYQRPKKRS